MNSALTSQTVAFKSPKKTWAEWHIIDYHPSLRSEKNTQMMFIFKLFLFVNKFIYIFYGCIFMRRRRKLVVGPSGPDHCSFCVFGLCRTCLHVVFPIGPSSRITRSLSIAISARKKKLEWKLPTFTVFLHTHDVVGRLCGTEKKLSRRRPLLLSQQ